MTTTAAGIRNGSGTRAPEQSGPSVHVVRARKLLIGGLVGGLAATVGCGVLFTILHGTRGLITVAISAAIVLFFYGAGQLIMVAFANAGARTLMLVSLMSYSTRVLVLGLVLLSYNNNRAHWPSL